jgi:hypothetical protein
MESTPTTSLTPRRIGERATGVAHQLLDRVETRLERTTGRPSSAWLAELHRAVRERPLAALGAAIAAGYLLGKLAWRR